MICPHCAYPNDPKDPVCGKCRQPLKVSPDDESINQSKINKAAQFDDDDNLHLPAEPASEKDVEKSLQACLAEAHQKTDAGDLRSAFLICQAFVMDHYGEIPEQAMMSLYETMGEISKLQDKAERAEKYLQKAELIRQGCGPTGIPPKRSIQAQPIQDVGFDDMEDIDEPLEPNQLFQDGQPETQPSPMETPPREPDQWLTPTSSTAQSRTTIMAGKAIETTSVHKILTAGVFIRLGSFIMDVSIVTSLFIIMSLISSSILDEKDQNTFQMLLDQPSALLLGCTTWVLLFLIYHFMFSKYGGQTMGKVVLGIQVVGLDGKAVSTKNAFLRSVGFLTAGLPALAGFFWAGFDTHRRGWHDYLGGTVVIQLQGRGKRRNTN